MEKWKNDNKAEWSTKKATAKQTGEKNIAKGDKREQNIQMFPKNLKTYSYELKAITRLKPVILFYC